MKFVRTVGGGQHLPWIKHSREEKEAIDKARALMQADRYDDARRILEPLIERGNAEAQFIGASFSWGSETEDEFNKRYVELLTRSAGQGFPPALYALGYHYDTGDLLPEDKVSAAQMFRRAAEARHAHSQWILGLNLLYGQHGIPRDEALGLQQIRESAEARFQGALETLARFYEKGEWGYPVDPDQAKALRERASAPDTITF